MRHKQMFASSAVVLALGLASCGDEGSSGEMSTDADGTEGATQTGPATGDTDPSGSETGDATDGSAETGSNETDGPIEKPNCDEVPGLIEAYKMAHPGNGGKDWDINAKSQAELDADPAAQELLSLCGADQRPVLPQMAWEYGGNDHPWIDPEASALFYCVYIPVNPSTEHWQYDAMDDHVIADVYIGCPQQNPCNGEEGAQKVMGCLGDMSNIEIIVDTVSLDDGIPVGLDLSEAYTDLYLILEDGTKVHLYTGL